MKHSLALIVLLPACGSIVSALGPHPPKDPGDGTRVAAPPGFSGPTRLIFEDGVADPVCEVHLVPSGQPRPGPNLLTGGHDRSFIRTGYEAEADVKPGTYWTRIVLCNQANETQESDLDVSTNLLVRLTFDKKPEQGSDAMHGFQHIIALYFATPDYILHPPPCIPDGQFSNDPNITICCSGQSHWSPVQDRYVCGPGPGG